MSTAKKRNPAPVKLIDVANEAEVSIATVSLALRNDPSISEVTRRRVHEAQQRLGYQALRKRTKKPPVPAQIAKVSCGSLLYCIVNFPLSKHQYAECLEGVMQGCSERGVRLELKSVSSEALKNEPLAAQAGMDSVDGVILTGELDRATIDAFLKVNPRTLILGNYPFEDVHTVELDLFRVGEAIAERVVKEGHKHVVHLLRDPDNLYERRFLGALREALSARGISLPPTHILKVENLFDSITQASERILALDPDVTAITTDATNIAEACITELRYRWPKESKNPLPMAYTVGFSGGGVANVKVLNIGLERSGWLAVQRLCQMYAESTPFPFSSVVHAGEWRDAE
jgi:DNA-binding LacI/PurR family transcriptional regulator